MNDEPPITAKELQELYRDENFEQLIRDKIVNEIKEDLDEDFSKILRYNLWDLYDDSANAIIVNPEVYKVIEDYNNQNAVQKFLQNIKWGFKDCRDNYRNWKSHMRGEDWDFWEILSGEWSVYE